MRGSPISVALRVMSTLRGERLEARSSSIRCTSPTASTISISWAVTAGWRTVTFDLAGGTRVHQHLLAGATVTLPCLVRGGRAELGFELAFVAVQHGAGLGTDVFPADDRVLDVIQPAMYLRIEHAWELWPRSPWRSGSPQRRAIARARRHLSQRELHGRHVAVALGYDRGPARGARARARGAAAPRRRGARLPVGHAARAVRVRARRRDRAGARRRERRRRRAARVGRGPRRSDDRGDRRQGGRRSGALRDVRRRRRGVARGGRLELFLWTHVLTVETLDTIDRYEPFAVGTDDVELLRAWVD